MKKIILSLAVAIASLSTLAAVANNVEAPQTEQQTSGISAERGVVKDKVKKDKKGKKEMPAKKGKAAKKGQAGKCTSECKESQECKKAPKQNCNATGKNCCDAKKCDKPAKEMRGAKARGAACDSVGCNAAGQKGGKPTARMQKRNKDARNLHREPRNVEKRMFNPLQGIQLTPTQQQQISNLNDKREKSIEKVQSENKKKCEKIRENYNKDIKKILSPEQYLQYQNNKQKAVRAGKGEGKKGNCDAAGCVVKGKVGETVKMPERKPLTE